MTVRAMSVGECEEYFGSTSESGILLEDEGLVVGVTGWNTYQGFFFAHSTFCSSGHPDGYTMLAFALRRAARLLGFSGVRFVVDAANGEYLRAVKSIRGVRPLSEVLEWEL